MGVKLEVSSQEAVASLLFGNKVEHYNRPKDTEVKESLLTKRFDINYLKSKQAKAYAVAMDVWFNPDELVDDKQATLFAMELKRSGIHPRVVGAITGYLLGRRQNSLGKLDMYKPESRIKVASRIFRGSFSEEETEEFSRSAKCAEWLIQTWNLRLITSSERKKR